MEKKKDLQDIYTNIVAVLFVIAEAAYEYITVQNGGEINPAQITIVCFGALFLFLKKQGGIRGINTTKAILIFMLPLLFVNCSTLTQGTNENFVDSVGVEQLQDVIKSYYLACETTESILDESINYQEAAMNNFIAALNSLRSFDLVKTEILNLSDPEIQNLTELHTNYNLSNNRDIYKSVCTLVLYGLQAGNNYYLTKNNS